VARPIVFLSDYGLDDEFVGICHGVIARLSPHSTVIHLTHAIPPQDVLRGALAIAHSIRFLPEDAVILGVVDPGVGTPRRPVAVETVIGGRLMVGPDNGLLSLAWAELGGVGRAARISAAEVLLEPVSATFHGRDIFAPAAAHLAAGLPLEGLGSAIDPASLARAEVPEPAVDADLVDGEVLVVDRFGNLQLSVRPSHLAAAGLEGISYLELGTPGGWVRVRRVSTFGDVSEGEHGAIVDSAGWMAIVLNRGSASDSLGLVAGDSVALRRPA
jgi:S-adenosylmethionine hydrolase